MNWISVKEQIPRGPGIIVAIMNGRQERADDPIIDGLIVILRSYEKGWKWFSMDGMEEYYLPKDEESYYHTINYWIPWNEFEFPSSMIVKEKDKQ